MAAFFFSSAETEETTFQEQTQGSRHHQLHARQQADRCSNLQRLHGSQDRLRPLDATLVRPARPVPVPLPAQGLAVHRPDHSPARVRHPHRRPPEQEAVHPTADSLLRSSNLPRCYGQPGSQQVVLRA